MLCVHMPVIQFPFHLRNDTTALEKVKRRGANKAGDKKLPPYTQRQSRLGICTWGKKLAFYWKMYWKEGKPKENVALKSRNYMGK